MAGAETEELQQRLSRLRQAAVPTRGRGRGARARGRGRGGAGRGAVPGRFSSIDRRPTTLIVSDFAAVGRAGTVAHLTRFGEVTDCRPAGDTGAALAVTFGTRRQAEAALAGGATVGVHRLTLGWPLSATAAAAKAAADVVQTVEMDTGADQAVDTDPAESPTNLSDFEDDEGDDADDEDDRSWRP
ncbi:RNA-binding protein 26-like [Amphibalanus amphitrite]|uniref:RNA-binding protein 26-like n=1 Tax=Amphibalanus amphitrite TaxID=1232801 RepID=UPI001C900263|nr:RNA-binding protein 26-like [Amphibalanus amphitrite]